jgi:hypothetical protein
LVRSVGRHCIGKPPFIDHPKASLTSSANGVVGELLPHRWQPKMIG